MSLLSMSLGGVVGAAGAAMPAEPALEPLPAFPGVAVAVTAEPEPALGLLLLEDF
jgi:hypothetical protein